MQTRSTQIFFLEKVKESVSDNVSLVAELAELLHISMDSAYRRLRGDTDLSFEEAVLISNKYGVSLDNFANVKAQGAVLFKYEPITSQDSFVRYLKGILKELELIKSHNGNMIYQATVLPFFYSLGSEYFTMFKYFTWNRYIHNIDAFQIDKIESSEDYLYIKDLLRKIYRLYEQIDTVEVWTEETIDSTINQIKYFKDLGVFKDKHELTLVCEEVKNIIVMLHKQTVEKQKASGAKYDLYMSELSLDNTYIVTRYNDQSRVYLRHQFMNTMNTNEASFCEEQIADIQKTIQKSSLLSGASEKQRSNFFKKMSQKIDEIML